MLFKLILLISFVESSKITKKFIEEPKDIETIIGSTVVFHCQTEFIDQNQINWCKNDFCTLGKTRDLPFYPRYEIIGDVHKGEHHFKIVNVSLEDVGFYQCQIRAGPQTSPSISRKAKLTVLQIPTSLSIDNPIVLVENVLSNIICRATDAMPEAKLIWNFPKPINYLSKNDFVILSEKSLRNSISNITVIPNRSFHRQVIQCQAISSAIQSLNKTIITQQIIQIIFKPEINLTTNGKFIENDLLKINCDVQSRPIVTTIEWFNGTTFLKKTNETSLSINLTRFTNNNKITCRMTNQVGQTNQSIVLNVFYKPMFVDSNRNQLENSSVLLVNKGETVRLKCLVDSNPKSNLSWSFNGKILLINKEVYQINSFEPDQHIGFYVCSAFHQIFGNFNRTIRVALKGPPEIINLDKKESSHFGQTSILSCLISKDIPFQEMFWLKENRIKIQANEKYEVYKNDKITFVEFKLKIKNLNSNDQGVYVCQVENQFGTSNRFYHLNILNSKTNFIRKILFYFTTFIGLLLCFIFIFILLINYYRTNRSKSSVNDETNSSFSKQQEQFEYLYQDDSQSVQQHFISPNYQDNFIGNSKTYSTVV